MRGTVVQTDEVNVIQLCWTANCILLTSLVSLLLLIVLCRIKFLITIPQTTKSVSHQSHYTNSRNSICMSRPRLDLFKTSTSFAGVSLWNTQPQNINCICLPCFRHNVHKYISENNFSADLEWLVCQKWVLCVRPWTKCKYCNSDASAFVETPCNCIDLLFTHAYMCDYSIVVRICVCSIARTGCY